MLDDAEVKQLASLKVTIIVYRLGEHGAVADDPKMTVAPLCPVGYTQPSQGESRWLLSVSDVGVR